MRVNSRCRWNGETRARRANDFRENGARRSRLMIRATQRISSVLAMRELSRLREAAD